MNEHDFFKQMIHDRAVNDAVVKAKAKMQTKRTAAWRRPVAIAAATLAVIVGTVFLIPSARAEVLSWFGVSTPQDYLTTDPDDREKIPEIDALIASPDANEDVVKIPIDRTDSDAVNSEGALKVSAFLHENCDVALGEAMFDGEHLYQTIRLNGLSGLYLLEQWTGSRTMAVPVDPYAVWGLYENGPEEEYLSGEKTLYEWPESWIMYEMPDGTRFGGMLDLTSSIEGHLDHLDEMGLLVEDQTEEQQNAVDAENRAYLEQNGLMAAAEMFPHDYEQYLDADGNLTAKVYYVVKVIEEDRGDGSYVPDTELYNAQIGTITVNMKAYQNIESTEMEASAAVMWDAETVVVSKYAFDNGEDFNSYADDRVIFSKHLVSTEGLTMTAESIQVDALSIHDLKIRIAVPEAWTQDEREAFVKSLEWIVLLNGESGQWRVSGNQRTLEEDGTLLFTSREISNVPYDMLQSIKTITLIPKLHSLESLEVLDIDNHLLGILNPDYGEIMWSEKGGCSFRADHILTEYPQYAITLNVQ